MSLLKAFVFGPRRIGEKQEQNKNKSSLPGNYFPPRTARRRSEPERGREDAGAPMLGCLEKKPRAEGRRAGPGALSCGCGRALESTFD